MGNDRKNGYLVLLMAIGIVLTLVLSMILNMQLQQRNDLRMCATLRALIQAYDETPPTTATGRNVERAYNQQYAQYNCRPVIADSSPTISSSTEGYRPSADTTD